jgi:hypothetical protein
MARWPEASIESERAGSGVSAPVLVTYLEDHRISVPKPVAGALTWLAPGSGRQEVVCEFAEPGRIIIHPAQPLRERLLASGEGDALIAESVRLVYAVASFVLNSLRLHDRAAMHLFGELPLMDPDGPSLAILARNDRIELWSTEVHAARHRQARRILQQGGLAGED